MVFNSNFIYHRFFDFDGCKIPQQDQRIKRAFGHEAGEKALTGQPVLHIIDIVEILGRGAFVNPLFSFCVPSIGIYNMRV